MNKYQIFKNDPKKVFITTAAISAFALVGYELWKRYNAKSKQNQPIAPEIIQKEEQFQQKFLKDQIYCGIIKNLKKVTVQEVVKNKLSKQTLMGINKAAFNLIKTEYLSNLREERKVRRNFMSNYKLYSEELFKASEKNEALIKQGTNEVLKDLDIGLDFHSKQSQFTYQFDPNFAHMNIFLLESIKGELESSQKPIDKEQLIKFYKFQIDNFDNYNFQSLALPIEALLIAKKTFIADMASIKIGVEEENILKHKELINDPEVQECYKKLEEKIYIETQKTNRFSY